MGQDVGRDGGGAECLLVRSGGYRGAIPVATAKLVATAPQLIPVPGGATRLLGLAQIGGEPVAVVDLHALLDRDEAAGGSYELVVVIRGSDGGPSIAVAVDEALGVAFVAIDQGPDDGDPEWVAGRSVFDDQPLFVLDPERLTADR